MLKQASWIATIAAIIGLFDAIREAATLDSLLSIYLELIGPLTSFLPALALLIIVMNDYGLTTRTSRFATILIVVGGCALFAFAISTFFI